MAFLPLFYAVLVAATQCNMAYATAGDADWSSSLPESLGAIASGRKLHTNDLPAADLHTNDVVSQWQYHSMAEEVELLSPGAKIGRHVMVAADTQGAGSLPGDHNRGGFRLPRPPERPVIAGGASSSSTDAFVVVIPPMDAIACTVTLVPGSSSFSRQVEGDADSIRFEVSELTEGTEYTATATCEFADGGESPKSAMVQLVTCAAACPAFLDVKPTDYDSGLVTIVPPFKGCKPTMYSVSLLPLAITAQTIALNVPASRPLGLPTPVIANLQQGMQYEVFATGVCQNGERTPTSSAGIMITPVKQDVGAMGARIPAWQNGFGAVGIDAHLRGFDSARVAFHGAPHRWYSLLRDGGGIRLSTAFELAESGTTAAYQVRLVWRSDVVRVQLVKEQDGEGKQLEVYIGNSKPARPGKEATHRHMSGGTVVTMGYWKYPPGYVLIQTPQMNVLVTLNNSLKKATEGLNVYITVKHPLAAPTSGLLGESYTRAMASQEMKSAGAGTLLAASLYEQR